MKEEKERRLQAIAEQTVTPDSEPDCAFCSLFCGGTPEGGPHDSPSPHFMTEREMNVLATMRRLRAEASEVKQRLRERAGSEDRMALKGRLADLRAEWKKVDQERMDAAEERMRLLGHIQ